MEIHSSIIQCLVAPIYLTEGLVGALGHRVHRLAHVVQHMHDAYQHKLTSGSEWIEWVVVTRVEQNKW